MIRDMRLRKERDREFERNQRLTPEEAGAPEGGTAGATGERE